MTLSGAESLRFFRFGRQHRRARPHPVFERLYPDSRNLLEFRGLGDEVFDASSVD